MRSRLPLWLPRERPYDELTMATELSSFDFWKMQGCGNDFVLAEADSLNAGWEDVARQICDRHFGVGADGLILVLPSERADRRMVMYNPDGSDGVMCGNGLRCFVKYLHDRGVVSAEGRTVTVETGVGIYPADATFDADGLVERVRVGMGEPMFEAADLDARVEQAAPILDLPIEAAGESLNVTLVSMGNPHSVQFIDVAPADFDLDRIGPAVEHHALFADRTNFEVVHVLDRSTVEMRVWERGVGETLACGSGACAVAVAARLHGHVDDNVEVRVPGGTLMIEWDGEGQTFLEGPATLVFESHWKSATKGTTA